MTATLEVVGCLSCPLSDYAARTCAGRGAFGGREIDNAHFEVGAPPPEWCPLRAAPVLVKLKGWRSAEAKDVLEGGAFR